MILHMDEQIAQLTLTEIPLFSMFLIVKEDFQIRPLNFQSEKPFAAIAGQRSFLKPVPVDIFLKNSTCIKLLFALDLSDFRFAHVLD